MKLYATTTSERATKGQGGNDFLNIVITDENNNTLFTLEIEPDSPTSDEIEFNLYTQRGEHIRYYADKIKGKKKKDEQMPPQATDGEWDEI